MAKRSKGGQKKKSPKKTEQKRVHKKEKKKVSRPGPREPKLKMASILFARLPSWYPLPLFMLAGILFRLSVTLWEPLIYPDSPEYLHQSREIRSGVFFEKDFDLDQSFLKSRRRPPLYPFLLAPFANTGFDLEYAGISVSLLMSILSFIPLYLATAMIFSRRAAIISSALLSFHPFTIMYSSPILTESTFTALFMGAIALSVYCLTRPSLGIFAVSGVLCSLLYMTRDVGITAVFVIGAGAVVKLGIIDRIAWRRLVGFLAALAVSFLFVSAPYFTHIRVRTGAWGLTLFADITNEILLIDSDGNKQNILENREYDTRLLGQQKGREIHELLKVVPELSAKLSKNMRLYGLELVQRWGTFVLPFFIIGLIGVFHYNIRTRDWARLFMQVWLVVWILLLWSLYSLITPRMIDDRYMYPLMLPGIVIAGHGISTVSKWLKNLLEDEKEVRPSIATCIRALVFPALLLFYLVVLPSCMEPLSLKYYPRLNPSIPVYLFPFAGLAVLFGLAMAPGVHLAFASRFSRKTSDARQKAMVFVFVLAGLIALWIPDLEPPFIKYFPGFILTGIGLALAPRIASAGGFVKTESFARVLSIFLVAVVFFAQWPDLVETKTTRMSPQGISKKFSAGYKQAAAEIKARRLVPPGKVISARKPFMAFYLDGKTYGDGRTKTSMPKTISELRQLIRSGSIDYLAGDSATSRQLRPSLTEVVFGLKPLPEASIIYTKHFPEFNRIITLYDCRRPEPPLPDRGDAKAHLAAAQDFYRERAMPFAYREAQRAVELDPDNRDAWLVAFSVLHLYYKLAARKKIPTKFIGPNVLSLMYRAGNELVRLDPDDPQSKLAIDITTQIRKREEKVTEEGKQKRKKK